MNKDEVKHYKYKIIPKILEELKDKTKSTSELVELYNLYDSILQMISPYDFSSFNDYLELEEDKNLDNRGFHHHRKKAMKEVYESLNDMEINDAYDTLLISLPPRTGKEQPLSSKILTPTGWKTMGDMKIGSKVIGYDGKPCNVTGVFPQGIKDVYRVTFDDDTSVECGLEHLWTVRTRDDRRRGKERTVTTSDMMKNLYVENGTRKNYSIDYVKPVKFSTKLKQDDLHPYLVGALIGDGGLSYKSSTIITNIDLELLDKISEILPKEDVLSRVSNGISYRIVKRDLKLRNKFGYAMHTKTISKLRDYGLDMTHSNSKFIPKKYLYGEYETRLELLKGLMDTDGYTGIGGSYCEYCTVSEQLCEDFVELVRSLGGRATVNTKIGSYKKNGIKISCQKVYRIVFNMEINPFFIERKRKLFVPRTVRNVKYITDIKKVSREECQCIMVDSPKHLYVTDGYNLTHNTTYGIRFLAWICGKYPEYTQLATSYSDSITTSFYAGVLEVMQNERYIKCFPSCNIINQNAKREEIWLKTLRRYPTIAFVSVGGSVTGRVEANNYLYVDDIVSGIEEAMSPTRLEKLWQIFSVNFYQRKKEGCKLIMIATRWSVNDPLSVVERINENNPRFKSIKIPCFDENEESNFDFVGGFSKKYYLDMKNSMDDISFNSLYMCEPIEREGLLYHKEDLMYYFDLPEEKAESIVAICDSKNMGVDYVSSIVGCVYGDLVYIDDVVYNNGLPEITRPLVADMWVRNKVVRADVELNNGGNYYAEDLDELVKQKGGKTSIRIFYSGNNKNVKIITYSDYVIKHFVFRDPSTYSPNSDYARFMKDLFGWTQSGKNKHDDAPDSVAMLAQMIQDLQFSSIKIIDRKRLGI